MADCRYFTRKQNSRIPMCKNSNITSKNMIIWLKHGCDRYALGDCATIENYTLPATAQGNWVERYTFICNT